MRTAQTIQLLDANNNNISPAVCVDSIYFEGAIGTDTYRFALRDRIIVGSEDLISGPLPVIAPTADSIMLPTLIAEEVRGSGIWQIKPAQTDVTQSMKSFISQICEGTYVQNSSLSENYLDLLGKNKMKGNIEMSSGLKFTNTGISSSNNNSYINVSNGSIKVISNASVFIDSPDIILGKTANNISIGSQSTTKLSLTPKSLKADVVEDIVIQSKDNTVTIIAKDDASIITKNGNVHIGSNNHITYLHGSQININGAAFPIPGSGTSERAFVANTDGIMSWKALGSLNINGYGSSSGTKHIDFITQSQITASKIVFTGTEEKTYNVLGDSGIENINVRHLKSGTNMENLNGSTAINIKTINGQSILGSDDIKVATKENFDSLTKVEYITSGLRQIACVDKSNNTVRIMPSNLLIQDDILYAQAFVMASDEKLKTEISFDGFDKEMPPIHSFKWKDSSIESYGFIAQELETYGFSNLVYEAADGIKRVDYPAALAYKIARLEKENKILWSAIEELKKKLS